jgi:hypothetical protein
MLIINACDLRHDRGHDRDRGRGHGLYLCGHRTFYHAYDHNHRHVCDYTL